MDPAGRFITLEGGEGAGKSTQAKALVAKLQDLGHQTVLTREPGGSPHAEEIRKVLLSGAASRFGPFGEAILFAAARDDHLEQVIRPALAEGKWVVSDRFSDSTKAYQGAGAGLDRATLDGLERVIVGDTRPDLTIVLDVPPENGLARVQSRAGGVIGSADRFEAMDIAYHERLRNAFLDMAAKEPERFVVIDGTAPPESVAAEVWRAVEQRLGL